MHLCQTIVCQTIRRGWDAPGCSWDAPCLPSGAELVGDRGVGAALVPLCDLLVENLGTIDTRAGFHSSKSIFPPGKQPAVTVVDAAAVARVCLSVCVSCVCLWTSRL